MARLQILQLPAGAGDDRPPFVLVVDETVPQRVALGPDTPFRDYWEELALQIGARGVIVTPETVDIPANELLPGSTGARVYLGDMEVGSVSSTDSTDRATEAESRLKALAGEYAALQEQLNDARMWARHGYEIGQRHCGWSDHGVAPDWLTEGWPYSFDSCEHLKQAAEYDEALTRVRGLHRPVEHHGQTICAECSGYGGQSTDNAPVAHDKCGTLRALTVDSADEPTVKP
jgi:hypothetical protein